MATGTTTNYSFPFPLSTDPVNVASDIQGLATALDTDLSEIIEDASSSMITGGTNYGISTVYDDSAGTLSISVIDDGHTHIISNVDSLQSALDLKAPLASPSLTGTPTAPTQTNGNDSTRIATTAFVADAMSGVAAGVAYQTTAPASPAVGDVWVDSDEVLSAFSSNDFMLKAGGTFTGTINGVAANFIGALNGTSANFSGLVSGITPVSNGDFATKQYVDNATPVIPESGLESVLMFAGM
jgi:hypothetical protein